MIRVVHVITKLELGGAQENTLYTLGHLDPARFSGLLVAGEEGLLVDEARRAAAAGRYEARFLRHLVREVRPHRDLLAAGGVARLFRGELARARAAAGPGAAPALIVGSRKTTLFPIPSKRTSTKWMRRGESAPVSLPFRGAFL